MARLWKNEKNGVGKNGELVPNRPIFLPFSSHFQPISHICSTFPRLYFWQFLTIPHCPPFPPISPHFPPFSMSPQFSHFAAIFPFSPFFRAPAASRLIQLRLARMLAVRLPVLCQGAGDQIYGAMNTAMRLADAPALAFWRPLLWHIDRALLALPPYRGRLYRGISLRFSELTYRSGQEVCWPAFSSASTDKSVGESFVSDDEGTLFILQSTSARSIGPFSKFPEEAEVLFRPNTAFEITSTLFGNTDIGQFYSSVDNIAMRVSGCAPCHAWGPGPPRPQPPAPGRCFGGNRPPRPAISGPFNNLHFFPRENIF